MFKNLRQAISAVVNRPMTPLVRRMFGAVLWRDDGRPPRPPVARVLPQTRLEDLNPAMVLCLGQAIGGGGGDCGLVGLIEKLRETLRREE